MSKLWYIHIIFVTQIITHFRDYEQTINMHSCIDEYKNVYWKKPHILKYILHDTIHTDFKINTVKYIDKIKAVKRIVVTFGEGIKDNKLNRSQVTSDDLFVTQLKALFCSNLSYLSLMIWLKFKNNKKYILRYLKNFMINFIIWYKLFILYKIA